MKKLVITVLAIGTVLYVAKKSSVFSYASTLWSHVQAEAKDAVPTRFEISRARHEIANLDDDIRAMIRPIAEYKADISRLRKNIAGTEKTLAEQKEILLSMTQDLESSSPVLYYGGQEYSVERIRVKLDRDFASYKRMEASLGSQRKLLEAKETSLKATEEQLAKIISKKREYEVRLAQLEADEETLQIARIGSKLQIDDSRSTQIEAALSEIEHRHNVQRAEVELRTGNIATDAIPVRERSQPGTNGQSVQSIRSYLEATQTASK